LSFPVTNPVLIFALAMLLFVSAPLLAERLRVPGIVGLLVAGAIVGPNGFNLLARDLTIVLLGTVGLLYIMFIAGVEIDLHGFRRYRNRSVAFGLLTNALPQGLGIGLGLALGYNWAASVLLASMFASHTLVAYPVASRLGIARNEAVTVTVGGTIITDTLALLVLAVVAASARGALDAAFWLRLSVSLAVFGAFVFLVVPRIARWFFRNERSGAATEFAFVLAAIFICAYLAEVAGIEAIIGAFLAGLALNRLIPEGGPLMSRLQFTGNALFIPFFLLSVGMLVDVRVLTAGTRAWEVMLGMTATVMLTKWLAARATQSLFGYTREEGWIIFGLSVPQAAATLAATLVGYRIGLFDDAVLNGSILMILVTCVVGPWTVQKYGRRVALQEERKPYVSAEAPQRILIPMSNPATAEALLDLAFLVREPGSREPLYPLTVVPGAGESVEAQVANAEKLLGHAVIYAAGAEVPVLPLTRVDFNFASGIARGIAETRSSLVVVGWDARRSAEQWIFGSVLDQLLEQTRQLVLVTRLAHPLNTTKRVVLIVPPGAEREPGSAGVLRVVKTIAARVGAEVQGLVVGGDPAACLAQLRAARPEAPVAVHRVNAWEELSAELERRLLPDDLVVVLSARRGGLSWHRELEGLPDQLVRARAKSFIMMYPSEADFAARGELPAPVALNSLDPSHMVFDMPRMPLRSALRTLLHTAFPGDLKRLHELTDILLRQEHESPTEILPGVLVPHARVEDLPRAMLLLGTSTAGLEYASGKSAHLLFVLLSPADQPQEHLRQLAAIASFVGNPDRLDEIFRCRSAEQLFRLSHGPHA
jgi:Kef-type K+ transport system membrane component KefB/mannitol/fructose-specific phosphotransferase system IIA component (Ntr-type)/nucleotide-binding universal stress UspA family protein